jgi:DNA-binding NarL/FixJ family response regulator
MPVHNCLIIDDHIIFTKAMESLLSTFSNIHSVSTSSNVKQGIDLIHNKNQRIDVVFLDIHMPEVNGLEALKSIKETNKNIKIIIITSNVDPLIINKAIELGADAYLPKSCDIIDLKNAIMSLDNNVFYISPELMKDTRDISIKTSQKFLKNDLESSLNSLSQREIDVVKLIAKGYNNKEIGEKLFLSPLTIKTHRHNILQKLNLNNSAALVRFVQKWV